MFLIKPMRIQCCQHPTSYPLQLRMLQHAINQPLSQPLSTISFYNKNISQVSKKLHNQLQRDKNQFDHLDEITRNKVNSLMTEQLSLWVFL